MLLSEAFQNENQLEVHNKYVAAFYKTLNQQANYNQFFTHVFTQNPSPFNDYFQPYFQEKEQIEKSFRQQFSDSSLIHVDNSRKKYSFSHLFPYVSTREIKEIKKQPKQPKEDKISLPFLKNQKKSIIIKDPNIQSAQKITKTQPSLSFKSIRDKGTSSPQQQNLKNNKNRINQEQKDEIRDFMNYKINPDYYNNFKSTVEKKLKFAVMPLHYQQEQMNEWCLKLQALKTHLNKLKKSNQQH